MLRVLVLSAALCAASVAPAYGQASTAAATPYFPETLLHDKSCGTSTIGKFENEWYSGVLQAAGEPSLLPLTRSRTSPQVVRFLFLPSFENQIVVRVTIPATGAVQLNATKVSGDGRNTPYAVARTVFRRLNAGESARLRAFIARARVSQIPSVDCDASGLDGDTWVIETVKDGKYHYINRWQPGPGEVRSLGAELARLAGWQGSIAENRGPLRFRILQKLSDVFGGDD